MVKYTLSTFSDDDDAATTNNPYTVLDLFRVPLRSRAWFIGKSIKP